MQSRNGECKCVSKAKEGKVLETFCHTNQPTNQPAQQFLPNGTSRLTLGPDARKSVHSYLLWGFSVLLKVSPDFLGFHSRRRKSVRDVLSDRQRGGFSGRQRDLRPGSQGWPESPLLLLLLLLLPLLLRSVPVAGSLSHQPRIKFRLLEEISQNCLLRRTGEISKQILQHAYYGSCSPSG